MDAEAWRKFAFYEHAVQSPFATIDFIEAEFRRINRRKPRSLREDFCGTGWLACEWVRGGRGRTAVAVDVSADPIEYGNAKHLAELTRAQRKRMHYLREDVRRVRAGRFDVIVALNYSYCDFKTRSDLLGYFKRVRKALNPGGLFFVDLFGGTRSQDLRTRKTDLGAFTYLWQCMAFNPVANRGAFAMHFKPRGRAIIRNAFMYDWRIWTCPELREAMLDAGFKNAIPYWEGDDRRHRGGDGKFTPTEWEENCRTWRAFIGAGC